MFQRNAETFCHLLEFGFWKTTESAEDAEFSSLCALVYFAVNLLCYNPSTRNKLKTPKCTPAVSFIKTPPGDGDHNDDETFMQPQPTEGKIC